jgi:hypothetical protein
MIQIIPMEVSSKKISILNKYNLNNSSAEVLEMSQGNICNGRIIILLSGATLSIIKIIDIDKDIGNDEILFIKDSLLRSAASYGENLGADTLIAMDKDEFDFFRKEGFSTDTDNDLMKCPVSRFVHYI